MTKGPKSFDVVVVGAGPAGIAAACAAAESGSSAALLDSTPWLGGQIWRGPKPPSTRRLASAWLERLRVSGAQVFNRTTALGESRSHVLLAEDPEGALEIGFGKLILAVGARELFLPFPGWTLPRVLGPGGLHLLGKMGWPLAGQRVVVAGSGPLLLAAAEGLHALGARVQLIAEQAAWPPVINLTLKLVRFPSKLRQGLALKARLLGVPYRCHCWPVKAEGDFQVRQVTLTNGARTWTVDCDYLACAFNLVPNSELPALLGCAVRNGVVQVDEQQETTVKDVFCAGELTGIGGAECALAEGAMAGYGAAGQPARARQLLGERTTWHRFRRALQEAFVLREELKQMAGPDTLVCRCEDVARQQLAPYAGWRAAKLHTRCGMGPCQGRVCGGATRVLFGWEPASVRLPVLPARIGTLMGMGAEPDLAGGGDTLENR